jgi:thymidine phosphorylase
MRDVRALNAGYVTDIDNRALGVAVVALGGGRTRAADPIDHAVGLTGLVGLGRAVAVGDTLAVVHAQTEDAANAAIEAVIGAYVLGSAAPTLGPLVARRLEGYAA